MAGQNSERLVVSIPERIAAGAIRDVERASQRSCNPDRPAQQRKAVDFDVSVGRYWIFFDKSPSAVAFVARRVSIAQPIASQDEYTHRLEMTGRFMVDLVHKGTFFSTAASAPGQGMSAPLIQVI